MALSGAAMDPASAGGVTTAAETTTPAPAGGCSLAGFFDASCADYPTSYVYPANYTTRALVTLYASVRFFPVRLGILVG